MRFIVFSILSLIFFTSAYAESSLPSKGIIATSNPHASKAAKDIIDRGGNAIDATVAVQLVLTLTEPQATCPVISCHPLGLASCLQAT